MIARTLNGLGERVIAKRLLEDFGAGRIRFADLSGQGVMAETGGRSSGKNEMTLDASYLNIAKLARLINQSPYGEHSQLVSAAVTVFHEYQHMDQVSPYQVPEFEDPAWKKTDWAVDRWVRNLDAEWRYLRGARPSAERTKRHDTIANLLKRLLSEMGSLANGVEENERKGAFTKGRKWGFGAHAARIRIVLADISKAGAASAKAPTGPSAGKPAAKKPTSGWVLIQVVDYPYRSDSDSYNISYSRGAIGMGWALGLDAFGFRCTWSEPPKTILPSDRVTLDVGLEVTVNTGDYYAASGNFSVFFDHPDVKPGSVMRAIGLTDASGKPAYFEVSHKTAKTGDASSRRVSVDAGALGAGGAGQRIALIVDAYNGRNAGTEYIYEWKALP